MLSYARAASKGLVPAAAAVATTSICWVGEQSSSKVVTSKISNQGLSLLTRTLRQQQQQIRMLSTTTRKSMSTTTTTTTATAEAAGATTTASTATTTKKGGFSFLQWYEGHLTARPVVTKMFTGTLLWGIGDAVAQLVPPMFYPTTDDKQIIEYDFQRTGRAMFFGFVIHAPTSHVHYNFLEWLTVRLGVKGLKIPIFKAFMEQFVYWSWISNSMYHGAMGAMQGLSTDQITNRISDVLWETQKAQWVFWIPVQLINFQFVPVRHQLNIVLLTSIVWTALLSAWYPPVTEQQNEETEIKEEDVSTISSSSSTIVVEATSTKES